jgi:hypothetical protein
MRHAKDTKTNQLLFADLYDVELIRLSEAGQLICPCCEETVFYFSGSPKVTSHFKHKRGLGTASCENYVEGFNTHDQQYSNKRKSQNATNTAHINKQVEIECKVVLRRNGTTYTNLCITLKARLSNTASPIMISFKDSKNLENNLIQRDVTVKNSFSISLPLSSSISIENCNCSSSIDYVAYISELLEQHVVFPLMIRNAKESSILFRRKLFIDEIDGIFNTEASLTNSIVYRTETNELAIKVTLKEDGFNIKVGFAEEYCVYSPYLTNYIDSIYYFSNLTELSIYAFRSTKLKLEMYEKQEELDNYILDVPSDNEQILKIAQRASKIKCTNQSGIIRWFILSNELVDALITESEPNEKLEYCLLNSKQKVTYMRTEGLWSTSNTFLRLPLDKQNDAFMSKKSWNNANLENGF